MRLKRHKHPQGLRTKSDHVPEEPNTTSAAALRAAALTFNKHEPVAPSSPQQTKIEYELVLSSPPSVSQPKFYSHPSASTNNKNINYRVISPEQDTVKPSAVVQTEPVHSRLVSPSSGIIGSNLGRNIKHTLKLDTAISQLQRPLSPSNDALLAATIVAKANPQFMIANDNNKLVEDSRAKPSISRTASVSYSSPISRSTSIKRKSYINKNIDNQLNYNSSSAHSGSASSRRNSLTSNLDHSPYTTNNTAHINNSNSSLSFQGSHSSGQLLNVIGPVNRSSQSLLSMKSPADPTPQMLEIPDLDLEHGVESPAGLGVTITAPTPRLNGSPDSFKSANYANSFIDSDYSDAEEFLNDQSSRSLLRTEDTLKSPTLDLAMHSNIEPITRTKDIKDMNEKSIKAKSKDNLTPVLPTSKPIPKDNSNRMLSPVVKPQTANKVITRPKVQELIKTPVSSVPKIEIDRSIKTPAAKVEPARKVSVLPSIPKTDNDVMKSPVTKPEPVIKPKAENLKPPMSMIEMLAKLAAELSTKRPSVVEKINEPETEDTINQLEPPITIKQAVPLTSPSLALGFSSKFDRTVNNSTIESPHDNEKPRLNSKSLESDFMYQSPMSALKKKSTSGSIDSTDSSATLRRKPPPPVLDGLQPPSKEMKRLSMGSEVDLSNSPDFSHYSGFNSSNEDLKSKKTRKPPPSTSNLIPIPTTPTATREPHSYLEGMNNSSLSLLPSTTTPVERVYDGVNESQLTFTDEMSSINDSETLNESTSTLPKYPTYTKEHRHHHHPHIPIKGTKKLTKNAKAMFHRGNKSSRDVPKDRLVYYVSTSDHSLANLNPATTSQTSILIPQQAVKLKTTMRKDKKNKEFNVDKPWKHHNDIYAISEHERKRYEGVWVSNKDVCTELATKPLSESKVVESLKAAKLAAAEKPNSTQLMHRIIVREIFKRSRLPRETLRKIYNLVDRHEDGFLRKHEFIVGMWLIDQSLYGRKLPKQVDDAIWESVYNTAIVGVNITLGKKKKK